MIEFYEKPIVKHIDEIEKGDIEEFCYGTDTNIVRVIIDEIIRDENSDWHTVIGRYVDNGIKHSSRGYHNYFDIVGREIADGNN